MRYFRRSMASTIVRDGNGITRYVEGPHYDEENPENSTPGGIIAYDENDPAQAKFAAQRAADPGFFEVDKEGNPYFPPKEEPEAAAGETAAISAPPTPPAAPPATEPTETETTATEQPAATG